MPELAYNKEGNPSKEEIQKFLDDNQLFPYKSEAIGLFLYKLDRDVKQMKKVLNMR